MSDLKRRMATGAAWLVLFRLTDRAIGFISTLILARLLVPADFGLVAMGTSILAALELLGAFSFDIALIQNQRAERRHYDTAWTFSVLFGCVNAVGMCLLAAPAVGFFNEPRVEGLMYALALCTLIQGFDNVGIVAFQKDLELHKEFWFGLAKKLIGFVVTITAAFALQNFWALVCGMLALRVTSLGLSYVLHPYRPRLSLAAAGELFGFSKWLLLNNLLIFLNNRGTDFVVGKVSGAGALGLYSISYELANLPTTELVHPISRAVFPGYSRLAADLTQLRLAFVQVISLVALLTVPAGALIGLVAEPLVQLLLGAKWMGAVPLIQVLAVFGIVRSLHGPNGSIYLALGKPRIIAALQCVQLFIAIALMLYLVPRFGPIGAAWALLTGACVAMSANYAMVLHELKLPFLQLMAAAWRPFLAALAMALGVSVLDGLLWPSAGAAGLTANAVRLVALSAAGLACYVATVSACWMLAGRPVGAESQLVSLLASRLRPARKTSQLNLGEAIGKDAAGTEDLR